MTDCVRRMCRNGECQWSALPTEERDQAMRVKRIPNTVLRAITVLLSPYVNDITEWKVVKALREFQDPPIDGPEDVPKPGQLLTVAQVAERLQISVYTVHRMVKRGELRGVRVSRSIRVPEGEVIALSEGE